MTAPGGRILIAGVTTHWGRALAEALSERDEFEVVGLDSEVPPEGIPGVELIEADLRNPSVTRVIPDVEPDLVVHCGILWYPEHGEPSRTLHDINVIGTLNLLAGCERVPGLRAVVVRGSSAIYGTAACRPMFYTEEMAGSAPLETRFQRDIGELEGYVEGFAARRPGVTTCLLRFQPEVGPGLDSPLVRYLSLPVVPVQLGFDPLLQLLHPADATGALVRAVESPVSGPVNVAPDGSISLSRLLRLTGRRRLPLPPLVSDLAARRLGGLLHAADLHRDARLLLRFGRGCDNGRLKRDLGYRFAFDSEGTARDFARRVHGLPVPVATVSAGVRA